MVHNPHLYSRVSPRAKLEDTLLFVKRKPVDIDDAGGLEEPRRDVQAASVVAHHNIGLVRPVKLLISAEER